MTPNKAKAGTFLLFHDRDRNERRRRVRKRRSVPALLLFSLLPAFGPAGLANAHNLAPAYLELRERAGGEVHALWKISAVVPRGVRLAPALPCPLAGDPVTRLEADAIVVAWTLACDGPLVGRELRVDGLARGAIDALVHVSLADGREIRAILSAAAPALIVPAGERWPAVLASYARLGVAHLWTGLDHLLFVAGLTLLLGRTRRLVVAITAFTAGHSATLALAALGVVAPPQPAVELAIAATIVALALGLARAPGPPRGIARRPALLPFAFGLLHGLGFAGALGELGLPQHAIPLALLAFNLGIELGQLAWVALLLALALAFSRAAGAALPPRAAVARELATYAIGGLGVFWCLDRAALWLFP
jgi:hydrogenase/urease accessory protein HupE